MRATVTILGALLMGVGCFMIHPGLGLAFIGYQISLAFSHDDY